MHSTNSGTTYMRHARNTVLTLSLICSVASPARGARPFSAAAAYSFDAPMDLYLSEDAEGCANHVRQRRPRDARVLGIILYPDAYCSLVEAAVCQYTFAQDLTSAFASGTHGIRRSAFTAGWLDACVSYRARSAPVAQGTIVVSEASDLGMQGTYDVALTDGTRLRGFFDSAPCPQPQKTTTLSCF